MGFFHGAIVRSRLDIGGVSSMPYCISMPVKHTKTDYLKFAVLIALILLIESCINPDKPVWKLILDLGGNK